MAARSTPARTGWASTCWSTTWRRSASVSETRKEDGMVQGRIGRGLRILALAGIFGAGYLCGSLGQRSAEAQLGDVMKKAGEQGGALGSIGQLGSSIVEMQQHVDGLNKDLETLRKVKTALGGCGAEGGRGGAGATASAPGRQP